MKRTRYISLIIALLSVLGLAAQQQQSQYALYNYRNDGDFNAWLNIDVDSITYSNIGLDSVEYDNIVTQEVWTPDSCYRIPIEVIDSIGFRAPEPEFKEGIFHITEEHLPYAIGVDILSVTFDSSIPTSMLPAIGQVVISDVYDDPFEDGFAGRVVNIVYEDGTTRIECEEVGLEDVYDQLICVGKTIAYEDDEDIYSSRRKGPRKIKINEDGTIEVPLGKFSLKLSDGKTSSINLSAKPSIDIDYKIVYNVKGIDNKFMIAVKPKMEYGIDYTVKFKKDIIPPIEEFLGFIPVETSIPGLRCKIRFGGFLELDGNVSVEGKLAYEMKATGGYDSSIEENNGFFFSHECGWKDPEVSLNMEGSLFFGPMMQVYAYVLYDKGGLPYAKINVKPGIDVSGKIVANTNGLSEYGFSAYDLLKDTKVSFACKLKAEASAGMFGKEFKLPSYTLSPDWLKQEYYLFPEFTKPELKGLNETTFSSTALFSEVTRDILFQTELPTYVGMAVYDELDNNLAQDVSTRFIKQTSKTFVGHNMNNYSTGKYIVRPVVKNVFGTFVASPVTEFTVPEPMTLDISSPLNSVTLKKGQEAFYAINGGWGDYSVSSSAETLCSANLVTIDDKPYVKLVASKYMEDSAVITVKDLRPGTTETIFVTVSGEMTLVTGITLSQTTVNMQPSGTVTLTATVLPEDADNKTLAWESSNESVAMVSTGGIVTAIGEGSCVITCSAVDGSGVKAECQVTVTGQAGTQTGETLNVVRETGMGYEPTYAHVDFTAAKTYLGVNEVTTDMLFIINPDNSEVGAYKGTFRNDGWFNGDGFVTGWGTESMICVKFFQAILDGTYHIMDMNGADEVGKTYTTRWALKANGKTYTYTINVTFVEDLPHEYVDLGLPSGTLWATCNVGANSPEEYGDYFAWGETQSKDYYDKSTYFDSGYNKYNNNDNGDLTELLPEDDAATKNWGSPWHMPTPEQIRELLDNCTLECTTQGGVNGILVTGPSGGQIFLPAAGMRWLDELRYAGSGGFYWSSSCYYGCDAWYLGFSLDRNNWSCYPGGYRWGGHSVRPVRVQN